MTTLDYQWSSRSAFGAFNKLKGTENYYQWSKRIIDTLEVLNQYEVVTGAVTVPRPANPDNVTTTEKVELKLWKQRVHRAYIKISLRVDNVPMEAIMDTSNPKEAFDHLKDQYGGKSGEMSILITALATARLDPSKRIEEHYNKMLALRMELSKLGSTMANEAFLTYLLASLLEKDDIFVSSVNITTEMPASVLTHLKVIKQRQAADQPEWH